MSLRTPPSDAQIAFYLSMHFFLPLGWVLASGFQALSSSSSLEFYIAVGCAIGWWLWFHFVAPKVFDKMSPRGWVFGLHMCLFQVNGVCVVVSMLALNTTLVTAADPFHRLFVFLECLVVFVTYIVGCHIYTVDIPDPCPRLIAARHSWLYRTKLICFFGVAFGCAFVTYTITGQPLLAIFTLALCTSLVKFMVRLEDGRFFGGTDSPHYKITRNFSVYIFYLAMVYQLVCVATLNTPTFNYFLFRLVILWAFYIYVL